MKKFFIKIINFLFIMTVILGGNSIIASATTLDNQEKSITIFNKDNNIWNANYFRIPSMQILKDGTMLAF